MAHFGAPEKGGIPKLASKIFENKTDAVDYGRRRAKNAGLGQIKIQKRGDGKFQKEYAYRKDAYHLEG